MTILDLIQSATASLQDDTITDEHSDQRFAATSLQTGVAAFIFDRGGSNGGNGGTDGETPPDPTENNDSDLSDVTDDPNAVIGMVGTDGDDVLSAGDEEPSIFTGLHGSDTIYASNGNDTIYGGTGVADAGDAADSIFGNVGNDLIYGNTGNDTLYGGNNILFSFDGQDTIYGGLGNDFIFGGGDDDWLAGGGGIAHPYDEADTIYGGRGNDFIIGNGGDDLLDGGRPSVESSEVAPDGNDTIYGGLGNDTILGSAASDLLFGQFGNDKIEGGINTTKSLEIDTIWGGTGNDILYGDTEAEAGEFDPDYDPEGYADTAEEGEEGDGGDEGEEDTGGGEEVEIVIVNGIPFTSTFIFEDNAPFHDLIYGEEGIDTIFGGDGQDSIIGGAGNDLLTGNQGFDNFYFYSGDGVDVITDFQPDLDTLYIAIDVNGTGVQTAQDVISRSPQTGASTFGYFNGDFVLNLGTEDNQHLIILQNYTYEFTAEDGTTFNRYMPFDASNIVMFTPGTEFE